VLVAVGAAAVVVARHRRRRSPRHAGRG
jgi:hypothetical protein